MITEDFTNLANCFTIRICFIIFHIYTADMFHKSCASQQEPPTFSGFNHLLVCRIQVDFFAIHFNVNNSVCTCVHQIGQVFFLLGDFSIILVILFLQLFNLCHFLRSPFASFTFTTCINRCHTFIERLCFLLQIFTKSCSFTQAYFKCHNQFLLECK